VLDATRGLVAHEISNKHAAETAPAVRMVLFFMVFGLLLSKKFLATPSADKVALGVGHAAAAALLHAFDHFASFIGVHVLCRRRL